MASPAHRTPSAAPIIIDQTAGFFHRKSIGHFKGFEGEKFTIHILDAAKSLDPLKWCCAGTSEDGTQRIWIERESFAKNSTFQFCAQKVEDAVQLVILPREDRLKKINELLQKLGLPNLEEADFNALSEREKNLVFVNLMRRGGNGFKGACRRNFFVEGKTLCLFLNRTKCGDELIGRGGQSKAKYALWFSVENEKLRIRKVVRTSGPLSKFPIDTTAYKTIRDLSRANRAHGIAPLHRFGKWRGKEKKFFTILDFYKQKDLSSNMDTLTDGEKQRALLQIIRGVSTHHENGLVVLDIKPDNVLLKRLHDGSIKTDLSDPGMTKKQGTRIGETGTPRYEAPEMTQAMAKGITAAPSQDIWSLGILIGELFLTPEKRRNYTEDFQELLEELRETKKELKQYRESSQGDFKFLLPTYLRENSQLHMAIRNFLLDALEDHPIRPLLEKMLQIDPEERIDIYTALREACDLFPEAAEDVQRLYPIREEPSDSGSDSSSFEGS